MIYFLDASALVKRYVKENGTEAVRALFRRRRSLAAARLSAIEVPAALSRRVATGSLEQRGARRQVASLAKDLGNMHVVELRAAVVALAADLVWKHPLRAYDAVQLASALHLMRASGVPLTFVCADQVLCAVAKAEGTRVLHPA